MSAFAGIDLSMTSPAVCVGDSSDIRTVRTFFYSSRRKYEGRMCRGIYGMIAPEYNHEMERFHNLSEWVMAILTKFDVKHVCIEGYAMKGKGRVYQIGENGGILRLKLWQAGIKYDVPSPTQVKKHFAGAGNASKTAMYEAYVSKGGLEIAKLLDENPEKSPVSDVVDSYAMLEYGFDHFFATKDRSE